MSSLVNRSRNSIFADIFIINRKEGKGERYYRLITLVPVFSDSNNTRLGNIKGE